MLFREAETAFFVVGFAKNDQANVSLQDLKDLKDLAKEMFRYDKKRLDLTLKKGALEEIDCDIVCKESLS